MHDMIVAVSFVAMVFAPCIVALRTGAAADAVGQPY